MLAATEIRRLAADQAGMTLVELLVSLVVGLIVAMGAFTLLELSTRIVGRVTDQVGANQLGRQAAAYMENELQYSCIQAGGLQSDGTTWGPIQFGLSEPGSSTVKLNSDANDLAFWSISDSTAATGATEPASGDTITLHYLQYASNAFTDTAWTVTSGTTPSTFTYSSTPTVTTLGKVNNLGTISQNGSTPIFQYYEYSSNYQLSTTPVSPLTAAIAPNVAAVAINYQVVGAGTDSTSSTPNNKSAAPYIVNDEVDLRLTPLQDPSSTNVPYPCQ